MSDAQDKVHDAKHQAHQKKEHLETKMDEHQSRAKEAFLKKMTEMGLIAKYGADRINEAWDDFGSDVEKAAEWIKSGAKSAMHDTKDKIQEAKEMTAEQKEAMKKHAEKHKAKLQEDGSNIKITFMKKMVELGYLVQYGADKCNEAFEKFGNEVEKAGEWLKETAQSAAEGVKDKTADMKETVKKGAEKVKEKVTETTTDADRKEAKDQFEKREEVREEMARRAARQARHEDPTKHAHKPKVKDEL
jgi:hypothetical protein